MFEACLSQQHTPVRSYNTNISSYYLLLNRLWFHCSDADVAFELDKKDFKRNAA